MMFLAFIAGVVGILGYIPYIRDIFKKSTQPDRASWLIWLLQYSALFFAQISAGARESLWLIGLQLVGVVFIWILSFKYGTGSFDTRSKMLLGAVVLTLGIWYMSNSAEAAILLLLAVELSGVILTARKVYRKPGSETLIMWILVSIAGALSVMSIGMYASPILYVYPVSLVFMGLGVVFSSWAGKKRSQRKSAMRI